MTLMHRVLRLRLLRSEEIMGVFWSTVWLAYLAIPAIEIWTTGLALLVALAMTAMVVVFAASYVVYWGLVISQRVPAITPYGAALLLLLAILAACVGSSYGLGYTLCYAAAAVALAIAPRFLLALLALIAVAGLGAAISLLAHLPPWSILLEAMIVLSGGGASLGFFALRMQNDRLRQAREEIARLAVAEERLRFSRDLHDLLGHSLSVIVLKAELAHRMAERSPERTAEEVRDIEQVAREALREVREAVAGYRQPSLSRELESAAGTLRSAGLQVQVAGGPGTLPGPLDGALAWTVREATTNVIRHAQARRVRFEFARQDRSVRLCVANDGVSATTDGGGEGNGLRGLRERLRALGGDLDYGPRKLEGFSLTASLPLAPEGAPSPAPA